MERQRSAGSVQISLGASGAEGGDRATLDLYAWLRQTADVREHSDISLRPAQPDDTEAMGAAEIIDLALGHGFAALNLALAYASWRTARPSAPAVTLTTSRGSVTVHGCSDEEIRRIMAALHDGVPEGGVPQDGVPQDGVPEADAPAEDPGSGTRTTDTDTGRAGDNRGDRGPLGA
ncbi:effector-associated constant component EACC1 [Streptomyces blattellae]|uniref:effector-associated constant component EACC1 n=1 Tax=Streptomyces blattellae TaxID=2569855 RepID=UPI0018AC999E|nr:hypothetical protein [Streptomyces blattellae]